MKAVCVIASEGAVIDGDVVFYKSDIFDCAVKSNFGVKFTENKSWFAVEFTKCMPIKVKILWFWHMIVLRKSHVYLTGVLRK